MIGILLALQVNNWNEWRKERSKEKEILLEIGENIDLNSQRFQKEIEEEESVVNSIDIVLFNLTHQKVYHDSLDFHFLNVGYWPALVIKTSGYETLNSHGVDLIRSKVLKKGIIDLYEGSYKEIEEVVRVSENNAGEMLVPLLTDFFFTQVTNPSQKYIEHRKTPSSYHELIGSQKYKNVLSAWRHSRVVSIQLRLDAIKKNDDLTHQINLYLERN